MNQSKNYTAKDIERYHSGQLSPADMHAMEKAALDDLFLADALEGYIHTNTPSADLTLLQQKLQLRIEKEKKQKPLFYIGNNWMKIAALFILIAGGGWLILQTLSTTNSNELANDKTLENPIQQTAPVAKSASADSTNTLASALAAESDSISNTEKEILPSANDVAVLRSKPLRRNAPVVPAETYGKTESFTNLEKTSLLKENVQVDSSAVGAATALIHQNDLAKKVDTVRNMNVVLKPSAVASDEVVVMKNKAFSPQARQRMQVKLDTLEPAEGWTNFDDYIANNLRMPDELKTKPVRGEVELLFDVNNEGEPVNITVAKSLCDKCDEEAIRLLKAGPKWKNKNKAKGKVKIRF